MPTGLKLVLLSLGLSMATTHVAKAATPRQIVITLGATRPTTRPKVANAVRVYRLLRARSNKQHLPKTPTHIATSKSSVPFFPNVLQPSVMTRKRHELQVSGSGVWVTTTTEKLHLWKDLGKPRVETRPLRGARLFLHLLRHHRDLDPASVKKALAAGDTPHR